jgi:hypothetical protein
MEGASATTVSVFLWGVPPNADFSGGWTVLATAVTNRHVRRNLLSNKGNGVYT